MRYENDICLLVFLLTLFLLFLLILNNKPANKREIDTDPLSDTLAKNEPSQTTPGLVEILEHFLLLVKSLQPGAPLVLGIMAKRLAQVLGGVNALLQ